MILSEKIIKLRKQLGWSQEELAEKMDVSRQSVSKWESTNSIPDLTKIIKLAALFNVSTDFLLKDDIDTAEYLTYGQSEEVPQITLEQAIEYVDIKKAQALLTVKGVSFFVCSAVPLLFLLAMSYNESFALSTEVATAGGIFAILLMVSMGIRLVLKTNVYDRKLIPFENSTFELAYGVHSAFTEKLENFTEKYNNRVSLAVTLFITSMVPLLTVIIFFPNSGLMLLVLSTLFFIVTAGLWVLIPVSSEYEAYEHILNEGDAERNMTESERHAVKLAPFYWPLTVAIYLGWSLWTMNWGVTWIVWPVAGVLFAAMIGLMGLLEKDKK